MEGLIEAIFSNFFIIIIIIAGIIGFFRNNSNGQQEQNKKRTNPPRPTATPSGSSRQERYRNASPSKETMTTTSVEEQQRAQMERLANRYNTGTKQRMGDITQGSITENPLLDSKKVLTHDQEQLKRQMGRNLGRKGLINGIIMSEVLGRPRATKPYRSIITERRKI